ncbi:DUF1565 domain-containing protein [Massilia sp. TSP1-1-2]|uniref:DUF1565 domain-containing protein n=1 Tax=unclassified Massilia TaxID=2609279 RepID=UPI003CE7686D
MCLAACTCLLGLCVATAGQRAENELLCANIEAAMPHRIDAPASRGLDEPPRSPAAKASNFTNFTSFTNYYVAPNGWDNNPGTIEAPFQSIARAARAALPGTTVYVARGTYAGGFKTTVSGTADARIAFVSSTKWGARIVPPAVSVNDTAWDNRGSYVDIVGFQIDGSAPQGGVHWLHGIYNGGSFDLIKHNWIHHIAKTVPCTGAGGSAIGVDSYYRGVDSEVIGNLVHDIGPLGCRFIHGIYLSTSGRVANNVVYRVAEGAIHLWHDANNVIIANNTVTSSHTGIIVGGGDFYFTSGGNNHTVVVNNIVYDNVMGISEQGATGKANRYSNNLVYGNPAYNYRLNNGLVAAKDVGAPPGFARYTRTGTPDLHLTGASPAIGKASATYAPALDFDGKPRNAATGFDIGAYQH